MVSRPPTRPFFHLLLWILNQAAGGHFDPFYFVSFHSIQIDLGSSIKHDLTPQKLVFIVLADI